MTTKPVPEVPARPPCTHQWVEFVGQSGLRLHRCKNCDIRRLDNPRAEEIARQRAADGKNKRLDPG